MPDSVSRKDLEQLDEADFRSSTGKNHVCFRPARVQQARDWRDSGQYRGISSVFLFPLMMSRGGLAPAEIAASIVSALGILVTVFMLPETSGKTLEQLNKEAEAGAGDCQPPLLRAMTARAGS